MEVTKGVTEPEGSALVWKGSACISIFRRARALLAATALAFPVWLLGIVPAGAVNPTPPPGTSGGPGNAGAVAARVQDQVGEFADLLGAAAFLVGIGLVVFGIFTLYKHSKNPQDPSSKLSTAVMLIVAGGMMIAVPTVAGVGVQSLFGDGANTVKAGATFELRSLK